MQTKVFISYRRDDARAEAGRIRDRLAAAHGRGRVFMDVDDMSAGQRFDLELKKALDQCNVFLAVIGGRWLSLLDERRRSGQEDFVREEIAAALARDILVVPVLIDGTSLPSADALPQDIRALAYHQTHNVTHTRFGRDIEDLKEEIKEGLRKRRGWRQSAWRYAVGSAALVLLICLAMAVAWYGAHQVADDRPTQTKKADRSAKEGPVLPRPPVAAGQCAETVTFACLRAGLVHAYVVSDLRKTECAEERTYLPAELGWKSIWTTSVYSYAPGGGGPGGGLENEDLRVGGWGDWYHSLMQFQTPPLSKPVRFAAVLLFAKADDGDPVSMYLDRITQSWGWRAGDRLWWKDRPTTALVATLPQPGAGSWYAIDITRLLEDWRQGRSINHGLQLRPIANVKSYSTFHSTRSADRPKRPQLLVCT